MSTASYPPATPAADLPARMPIKPQSIKPEQRRSGDPNDPDPFDEIPGIPPNMGQDVLPHVVTFQGLLRNVARTYYVSDEAIQHSWDNARFMRNDPGIMECLEQRQRSTALLGWHLEAEDEKDPQQKMLVEQVTAILKQTPNFLKYRECLLHALWYGKYGVSHRFRWKMVNGQMRVCLVRWRPVNGDKLVFRYDDGSGEFDEDQVGIRVGPGVTAGTRIGSGNRWTVERVGKIQATDHGLAYFLEHWERPLLAIHKHMIEDAEYEAPERAGAIHGVGIRSRLYWLWYQKQETMAWLMEYLERSAFGIEIWTYPAGNKEAFEQTKKAAQERIGLGRNIVLVPRHPDSDVLSSDVKRIEPGMAGADILDRIIREYFGWQIKRYILGQILTSETASTGLGSGVATIHLDTYLQIVRYDATNLGETITTDTVQPLIRYNWPHLADLPIKFVIETEAPDVEGKLGAWQKAYEMGLRLKASDVAELIGAQIAQPGEEALVEPGHAQAQQQAAAMQAQAQGGQGGGQAGVRAGGQPASQLFGPDGQPLRVTTETEDVAKLYQVLSQAPEQYRELRPGVERITYFRHGRVKVIERYRASWDESKHPRGQTENAGEFAEKQGAASQSSENASGKPKAKAKGKEKTEKQPKAAKPAKPAKASAQPKGPAPGSQLDEPTKTRLRELGMDGTFPPADVPIQDISFADLSASEEELRYKALISWKQKTKSGRVSAQYRYTQAFHQRNAEQKFRRVEQIEPHIGKIAKELTRRMNDGNLQPAQREGAAIASLLLETGLRPTDSSESVKHGHFGAASLQVQHLSFVGNEVHLDFIGKEGIRNRAVVREPNMVVYLHSAVYGKQPGDFVFSQANSNHAIQTLKESSQAVGGPADILLKDLRTLKATKTAESVADGFQGPPPPFTGNEKKDIKLLASAILAMSGEVSKVLNNKPVMARDNYIHPRVWRQWQSRLATVN